MNEKILIWQKYDSKNRINVLCEYSKDKNKYLVTASQDKLKFSQSFIPSLPYFGGAIDLYDYQESLALANELSGKIEYILRLK